MGGHQFADAGFSAWCLTLRTEYSSFSTLGLVQRRRESDAAGFPDSWLMSRRMVCGDVQTAGELFDGHAVGADQLEDLLVTGRRFMGKEKWVGKDRLVLARINNNENTSGANQAGEMAQNCNLGFQI